MLKHSLNHNEHGNRYSCRALAAIFGCDASMVSFTYSQFVLKKRWSLKCNHGGNYEAVEYMPEGLWRDTGTLDPIRAISNCHFFALSVLRGMFSCLRPAGPALH
jgi:hypothetical protein